MKTKLIMLLLVLIPFISMGQEKKSGLFIGLNMAKWIGDADKFATDLSNGMNQNEGFSGFSFKNRSRVGFAIGFFIDYQIKESLSIQPEIQYIQKGTKFSGSGRITIDDGYSCISYHIDADMIMRTDYLELLVLAKYNLSKRNVKPYIIAGPGVGYLIVSKMKVKVTVQGSDSDSDTEKYDGFQRVEASLAIGGGFDFSESIRFDIRYQFGLIPVLKDEYDDGFKMRNGGFAINLVAVF